MEQHEERDKGLKMEALEHYDGEGRTGDWWQTIIGNAFYNVIIYGGSMVNILGYDKVWRIYKRKLYVDS